MKKILNDTKGAITVFVSLLLIPAILVSGTAVDLSRIHTARSIVQDGNQLAANSVLTQYDAMLQDIYGLYGVMESDPILGDMINEYIQIAVFGEEPNKELGTFQLFHGANAETTITPASKKNLANIDVLRRQIEEYAKFRAPVIIVDEIWDRIDKFKKLKGDSEVIENKMAIDEKIGEIDQLYGEIYSLINQINGYPTSVETAITRINGSLTQIKEKLIELAEVRDSWTDAHDDGNPFLKDELEEEYDQIKEEIVALIDDKGNENSINKIMDNSKEDSKKYIKAMQTLVDRCEEADNTKTELDGLIEDLKKKLDSAVCSEELVDGLTKPQKDTNKSIIEEYQALIGYKLKPMAETVKNTNESYTQDVIEVIKDIEEGSIFGDDPSTPRMSLDKFKKLPGDIFGINNIVARRTISGIDSTTLKDFTRVRNYTRKVPKGFKLFQDESFNSTKNKEFYGVLKDMYSKVDENGKKEADQAKGKMGDLRKVAQKALKIATLEPDGAKFYMKDGGLDDKGLQDEGDWADEKKTSENIKSALDKNIISQLGDIVDAAGNKLLLLTYDTEMFSNFTTVAGSKTMSGVPMGPDVNYFFQSELEYLFHGNAENAKSNLAAVIGLVFLVRFVFNYTSTFLIEEIEYELWLISSPAGPGAPAVREIARLAYTLAESAIDMGTLLSGPTSGVPLFKTEFTQWKFSLHSAVGNTIKSIPDTLEGMAKGEDGGEGISKVSEGVYYIDYVRILLLFQDGDTLAPRTANLIQWNITNVKEECEANEDKMSTANLFEMSELHTDFEITSTVDLRMLFLSMPFAQKGINGVIPQKTIPVTVTDYRGY